MYNMLLSNSVGGGSGYGSELAWLVCGGKGIISEWDLGGGCAGRWGQYEIYALVGEKI